MNAQTRIFANANNETKGIDNLQDELNISTNLLRVEERIPSKTKIERERRPKLLKNIVSWENLFDFEFCLYIEKPRITKNKKIP